MKSAILVIDVQQGLCKGHGVAFDCPGTIIRINAVTHKARQASAPVVFIQHESVPDGLAYGTAAWQLAQGLETRPSDHFIRKTTPDAFLNTDLTSCLAQHAVTHLVICGMHTEFCVDTSVRKALALGFPVTLVADGHTSAGNRVLSPQQVIAHHNTTLAGISSFGPRVATIPSAAVSFRP